MKLPEVFYRMGRFILLLLMMNVTIEMRAQGNDGTAFPYPSIPDTVTEPQARIAFMLEHFWQGFDFGMLSTAEGRQTAEQGFVDFVNLLQHADSTTAARSCSLLVDSLTTPAREELFSDFTERYLGDSYSPVRNDVTYAHLLRALPETPQRKFLIGEVTKNQVGSQVKNFHINASSK